MNSLESATLVLDAPVVDIESPIAELEVKSICCHHWLIDKANGPLSHGVCMNCGEEKDFSNSPPQYSTRNGMRRTFDLTRHRQLIGGYRGQFNQML